MNERIRELIKQSTECYSNGQERAFNKEKFAELIIKDCANVCHVHGWGMLEHNMPGHDIADDCGTMIKEHFGVEE